HVKFFNIKSTYLLYENQSHLKSHHPSDTFSFALFLSTFISSYKAILCTLRNLRENPDPAADKLNALIAGSIAGLSLAIERNRPRRLAIMLYLVARSGQFGCAWLMKRWAEHRRQRRRELANEMRERLEAQGFQEGERRQLVIKKGWDDKLAKFLVEWAGTGVMMLASAQIIYAFLFEGDTLPKSYFGFLLVHSGWKGDFGSLAAPLAFSIRQTVNKLSRSGASIRIPKGVSSREYIARHVSPNIATVIPPKLRHEFVLCALQHPLYDSCTRSKVNLLFREFARALKLYLPLNGIMTVAFRWNQITSQPEKVLLRFLQSTFRSALFLTCYVTFGMATPCVVRPAINREGHLIYVLAGVVAGVMVLVEAPGRRLELGLYCLPRALESFWRCMVKWGYARNVPHGDVLLFSAAMGVLMTLYQNEPDTIGPHYLSVMTRFFGRN
ncbi:hypothetical protein BC936DRAFT_142649, partial [Jimgerdemannia flammicorona]